MHTYLPTREQRLLVIGRNGSGKSRAAVWHLAQKNLRAEKWIVLNHKNEDLIDSIPEAVMVDDLNYVPKKPGVYIYHPLPEVDDEATTNLMWKIHAAENTGVYIDEGYMINPRDPALTAILTQGRSKKIPMIILSQRPSKISRFAVSEADFHQIFHLTDKRDRETVGAFVPISLEPIMFSKAGEDIKLPPFHSVYYDVKRNKLNIMKPVPSDESILSLFEAKLARPNKKFFI